MKKFSIAAVAALTLAAPAFADTKTSDDPFVSTQGEELNAGVFAPYAAAAFAVLVVAAAGDS